MSFIDYLLSIPAAIGTAGWYVWSLFIAAAAFMLAMWALVSVWVLMESLLARIALTVVVSVPAALLVLLLHWSAVYA